MEKAVRRSSRRRLLGRGLLLAGGALGFGAARQSTSTAAALPATTELELYGRYVHLHAPGRRSGRLPEKGARHTAYAELLDRPNGVVVGHFTAAHLSTESPFAGAASLEIHTFNLPDGAIHGLGAVPRGAAGQFVVLGGTGRYAGATGSYVARVRSRELGGDGTADFQLKLAGLEGADAV
jgi:hypothetical protein